MGSAWRESFVRWCQPWFWLLVAVALTVVAESLYVAVQDSLPEAFTAVADQFSVTATFSVLRRYKPLSLTASLPGCLALALGISFLCRSRTRGRRGSWFMMLPWLYGLMWQ